MKAILRELVIAHKKALQPDLAHALAAAGLTFRGHPLWGVETVEIADGTYQPAPNGKAALIFPAYSTKEDRAELCDLIAISFSSRRAATRRGICQIVGEDWIDVASAWEKPVPVYLDGIRWLRSGRRGVFIVDPDVAALALAGTSALACSDDVTANRLRRVMERPTRLPPIYVPETRRAAA